MNRLSKSAACAACVGLALWGMSPATASATPPGMGGGGGSWNWGSAAITALRGAQAIQEMRNANGENQGTLPRGYAQPRNNNQNNNNVQPRTNVVPRSNVLPPKNVVVVQPVANTGPDQHVVQLSNEDLARMKNELKDQNAALLNDLGRQISAAINALIDKLPGAANLKPEDRTRLQNAIESGNAAAVANLLTPADRNSPAGRDLSNLATARQLIDVVRTGLTNGTLNINDLVNLANAVNGTLPRDMLVTIGQIAVNQQITIWISGVQPGVVAIPAGGNVPIALVPGLQPGQIIPLGFGPVLIGMGQAGGNRILLGEGNVLQAAGLPSPIGPPTADYDGEALVGTVTLANAGAAQVNYNVNQFPYDMKPQFTQELGVGKWTVDFDRGGGNGTESYALTEGFYEFTPTDKGWELFKQSFEAVLENANDFDFHYVLDNRQQVLGAGKQVELKGGLPFVLRFENGNGEYAKKILKNGPFKVAVTEKVGLDIYSADAIAVAPKREQLFAGSGAPAANSALASVVGAPSTASFTLPAGFRPIDPVAVLIAGNGKTAGAQKLPAAFSLFAAGGGE